jgi:RHS repeat-associated protein
VQELSGSTVTANLLTGGVDEIFARTDSAGVRNFLTDALGSTLALTDSSGTVQTQYTYEPFGKTTSSGQANSGTLQYTARENDGTGLYYYRARYYNATLQRFISEDPLGFGGGDVNFYAYVGNDPNDFTDPFGLDKNKQTFNQCMAANASNFSLVGGVDAIFGTSFRNTIVGGLLGGNSITGLLYGSADDNIETAASDTPEILTRSIGTVTTYGRRTSTIMSLNLSEHPLPLQRVLSARLGKSWGLASASRNGLQLTQQPRRLRWATV